MVVATTTARAFIADHIALSMAVQPACTARIHWCIVAT
jgi:hypothetical protein